MGSRWPRCAGWQGSCDSWPKPSDVDLDVSKQVISGAESTKKQCHFETEGATALREAAVIRDMLIDLAPNVLDRSFEAPAPNRKWIADFTCVWTAEGWLYVAAVIDLFSRRLVGWSIKAEMTAQLVTDALMMAVWRRGKPDALLHHSDRGSQYASEQFQKLMADNGVSCSM